MRDDARLIACCAQIEPSPSCHASSYRLAAGAARRHDRNRAPIPGFCAIPEEDALLIGTRNLTDAQRTNLRDLGLTMLGPRDSAGTEPLTAPDTLARRADVIHLRIDLDVFDPSISPASVCVASGGLHARDVQAVVLRACERVPIGSLTLALYDPAFDPEQRLCRTALDLLRCLPAHAGS
ncbi:arginase family protein [Microbacterium meiriae (nom. nud.)]|uniref:arginase family protein n=1 Tax=Microbacterium meiriae (nom. nud.) TaxID=3041512 RepID=UPI003977AD18